MNTALKNKLLKGLDELIFFADELSVEMYRRQEIRRKWIEDTLSPTPVPPEELLGGNILGAIEKGYADRQKRTLDLFGGEDIDRWTGRFTEWQNRSENLILHIVGMNGFQFENFRRAMNETSENHQLVKGRNILMALRIDLERGVLNDLGDLASEEIFTDILETSEYLLEKGYKDCVAVMVGTVLENGLKRLAEKTGAKSNKSSIDSLNNYLFAKGVYTENDKHQIRVWGEIRNNAAHSGQDKYDKSNVKAMLEGVRRFLTEHLG